jgi:hypothetical protein
MANTVFFQLRRSFASSVRDRCILPRSGIDSLFIVSRVLSPGCLSLIQSMDILFELWGAFSEPQEEVRNSWTPVYPAFFGLFGQSLSNLHSLRLTIRMPSLQHETVSPSDMNELMVHWDRLASSRTWKRLQLCIPVDWYLILLEQAETQSRWELTQTWWQDRIMNYSCVLDISDRPPAILTNSRCLNWGPAGDGGNGPCDSNTHKYRRL